MKETQEQYQMREDEAFHARAKANGLSLGEQARRDAEDSIIPDIFPEQEDAAQTMRDNIARQQTELDQIEAETRAKADAYIRAVEAEKDTSKKLSRANEQLRELEGKVLRQRENFSFSVGEEGRGGNIQIQGTAEELATKAQWLNSYQAAIPLLKEEIAKIESRLKAQRAELAKLQK